jgi:hypothetical protein
MTIISNPRYHLMFAQLLEKSIYNFYKKVFISFYYTVEVDADADIADMPEVRKQYIIYFQTAFDKLKCKHKINNFSIVSSCSFLKCYLRYLYDFSLLFFFIQQRVSLNNNSIF